MNTKGKLFYVFPTGTKYKIYYGHQKQFNAYKQALATAYASHPACPDGGCARSGPMAGQSRTTIEGAGPHDIEVQQFGGFGPMGVNALGDW